jgi:hypothetical protein
MFIIVKINLNKEKLSFCYAGTIVLLQNGQWDKMQKVENQ